MEPTADFIPLSNEIEKDNFNLIKDIILLTNKNKHLENHVENILKKDPNLVNEQDELGCTLLMYACSRTNDLCSENTVKILIKAGANVNLQNKSGETALMLTVTNTLKFSTENTIKILIESKCDINIKNKKNQSASMLSTVGAGLYSTYNTTSMLIDAGADISWLINCENSLICVMFNKNDKEEHLLRLLIHENIPLNEQNITDATSVFYIKNLKDNSKNIFLLVIDTVSKGKITRKIKHLNQINKQDQSGETILMKVIKKNNMEIFKALIENKIDVNLKDKFGQNSLMILFVTNNENSEVCAENLIKAGININATNSEGMTALILLIIYYTRNDKENLIKLLFKNGAKLDMLDTKGNSALTHALTSTMQGKDKIITLLIQLGAKITYSTLIPLFVIKYLIEEHNKSIKM